MSDNGGPAFPVSKHPEQQFPYAEGMTLRDWFAGQALAGLLASGATKIGGEELTFEGRAAISYAQADAMLKERNHE